MSQKFSWRIKYWHKSPQLLKLVYETGYITTKFKNIFAAESVARKELKKTEIKIAEIELLGCAEGGTIKRRPNEGFCAGCGTYIPCIGNCERDPDDNGRCEECRGGALINYANNCARQYERAEHQYHGGRFGTGEW